MEKSMFTLEPGGFYTSANGTVLKVTGFNRSTLGIDLYFLKEAHEEEPFAFLQSGVVLHFGDGSYDGLRITRGANPAEILDYERAEVNANVNRRMAG